MGYVCRTPPDAKERFNLKNICDIQNAAWRVSWRSCTSPQLRGSMNTQTANSARLIDEVARYPLLTALRERRSRRFGLGMRIPSGPLAYQSRHNPKPLSE